MINSISSIVFSNDGGKATRKKYEKQRIRIHNLITLVNLISGVSKNNIQAVIAQYKKVQTIVDL